jgi:hypothetical protein
MLMTRCVSMVFAIVVKLTTSLKKIVTHWYSSGCTCACINVYIHTGVCTYTQVCVICTNNVHVPLDWI